jgi:dUTP pyrophosphatase
MEIGKIEFDTHFSVTNPAWITCTENFFQKWQRQNVEVKVYNKSGNDLPAYAKPGDSGMDVRSAMNMIIRPGDTALVPTGLFVGLPEGYELQARPRSGMSLKTKFRVANAPGTIDENYRGELCIIADNIGETELIIHTGDRIAQIVLQEVPKIRWKVVDSMDELGETERGAGGFGSTGHK